MSDKVISHGELERLASLRSDHGIVSAYVKVNPSLMRDRSHPLTGFKGSYKRFTRRTRSERWLAVAARERTSIIRFLENWQPRGRGLAIFACEPAGLWEVVSLNVPVTSLLHVDVTTHTGVLTQILDEYPRFVVAVVQRDRARIYTAEQGTAEQVDAIESEVRGRHDQGGWSQSRFQRHADYQAAEHLRKVSEELERLYYDKPYGRLAIGGSKGAVNELQKMLPEPVARRVIGTFPVDLKHDGESGVLDKARGLREADERESERKQVARVLNEARSDGVGAVGVEATLEAVREGRVRTLVVAGGIDHEGWVCLACDFFAAEAVERCPECGAGTERVADVLERAIERAYLTGATVDTVFGEARETLIAEGGVGALLRY